MLFVAVAPGEKRPVTVVTTNAPKKEAPCKIMDVSPKNRTTELKTKKVEIGYEATFSSWDIGIHKVKIEYDSQEVPGSPFEVVVEKLEINKVKVIGLDTRKLYSITWLFFFFFFFSVNFFKYLIFTETIFVRFWPL